MTPEVTKIKQDLDNYGYQDGNLHVYFILYYTSNIIKIGHGRHLYDRLYRLYNDSPIDLKLIGCTQKFTEKEVHKKFKHLHIRNEFYIASPELYKFINDNL